MSDAMTEDEELQMALQMSMQGSESADVAEKKEEKKGQEDEEVDPEVWQSALSSLPGINPEDPAIQDVIKSLKEQKKEDKEKK